MNHQEWIAAYRARTRAGGRSTLGLCAEATAEMVAAFPDLARVPGHVETSWGRRAHWWCETADGEIVDPTADQFPMGIFSYDAFKEGDEIRIGRCMNCGDEIWGQPGRSACVCSETCGEELHAEYGPERFVPDVGIAALLESDS